MRSLAIVGTVFGLILASSAFASATGETGATPKQLGSAVAPGWNGNLCEPDKATHCLGVQNQGHAALLHCLRENIDVLTPECKAVVGDSNMKSKAHAETDPESVRVAPAN